MKQLDFNFRRLAFAAIIPALIGLAACQSTTKEENDEDEKKETIKKNKSGNKGEDYDYESDYESDYEPIKVKTSKPNLNKIKKDLVGRRFSKPEDSYNYFNDPWTIGSKDIEQIKILNEEEKNTQHLFRLSVVLQGGGPKFDAVLEFAYNKETWEPEALICKELYIVRTGDFNEGYISYKFTHCHGLVNNSDIALLVGGEVIEKGLGKSKFCIIVPGNDIEYFTCKAMDGYRIDFIERALAEGIGE